LSGSIARDAMTDAIELAQLLDVDVDDRARGVALIAADRLGRPRAEILWKSLKRATKPTLQS
jgi:hypothetical protein